jgi:pyruvate formate lyase activating enzyme
VTNGYISSIALERIVDVIDAANVDWKAFNEEFYREHCSADLRSVLNATVQMKEKGVHIEITLLVIPETNDDENEIRKMASFIVKELGAFIPLHLSRYFPHHKFSHIRQTPLTTLINARNIALEEGIRYVYIGNIPFTDFGDTHCHQCGKLVVKRSGYTITDWKLDENNQCGYCQSKIPIVGTLN